jgi:hypothetical protein
METFIFTDLDSGTVTNKGTFIFTFSREIETIIKSDRTKSLKITVEEKKGIPKWLLLTINRDQI